MCMCARLAAGRSHTERYPNINRIISSRVHYAGRVGSKGFLFFFIVQNHLGIFPIFFMRHRTSKRFSVKFSLT